MQCVWMHDALKRVCLDKTVLLRHGQITLRATATRIVIKRGMYLSGEWRMFLHAADLTVVFLSTVVVLRSLHVQPYAHTHTVHPFIRTPLSLLPEQERGNTRTHRTTLLYDGPARPHKQIPCHARALLFASAKLTLGARASPLDRLCVSKPRGDGSHLRSPPWLSHVTSIATSIIFSQQ